VGKKPSVRKVEKKINEALGVLSDLGFPHQQQNERSALTLLALLGLKPEDKWEDAVNPLMGITPRILIQALWRNWASL